MNPPAGLGRLESSAVMKPRLGDRSPSFRKTLALVAAASVAGLLILLLTPTGRELGWAAARVVRPYRSVQERLRQYGPAARKRWAPHFEAAGLRYPPERLVFAAFKNEFRLEVYGGATDEGPLRFLRSFPIRGASGELGPKLRQGDKQVPEGIYGIAGLNPNSRFHLSLKLDYPNAFDRSMGERDGRKNLGDWIMIHGNQYSSGCLAMGDQAAEDLFVLVAQTGKEKVKAILAPVDFRRSRAKVPSHPPWVAGLYEDIRRELAQLPLPGKG